LRPALSRASLANLPKPGWHGVNKFSDHSVNASR
jgi:hypothetical protein